MFLPEYRICDSQNIDTEVQFIFRTLKTLGYDIRSIEKAHFRTRATFYTINQTNDKQFHNVLVYHQFVISSQPGNYCHQKLESLAQPNHNFAIAYPKAQLDIAFPVHHVL